jgi:hypothetical protein
MSTPFVYTRRVAGTPEYTFRVPSAPFWRVLKAIKSLLAGRLIAFGNSETGTAPADDLHDLVDQANSLDLSSAPDGWALLARYGDWPHEKGLQRFGRAQADEIVQRFRSTWGRVKRAIVGLPVFAGHPDIAEFANIHRDKTEYGQLADLEAREDGLWGRPVLSETGARLVHGGLKYVSPHWKARRAKDASGRQIFEPALLVSVGLTRSPNIPGPSLTNSKAASAADSTNTEKKDTTMPSWLLELLGLANEATEEQAREALAALKTRPAPEALANEQTARSTAEQQVSTLTADRDAQKNRADQAETALANERKTRREEAVASAVAAGRIVEADRGLWLGRLERDFATESVALANCQSPIKTAAGAKTVGIGGRKEGADRIGQIQAKVTERMASAKEDYDTAFANVRRDNPALFSTEAAKA